MPYNVKIYKLVNTVNDDIYIGSTKNELRFRFSEHKKRCLKYPERNNLYGMMKEYGSDCFRMVLITEQEVANREEQIRLEQQYIDELKPALNKKNIFGRNCFHGNLRWNCKICLGSQICQHHRVRSQCKACDGGSVCEHALLRTRCKKCGGGSLCQHGKRKSNCGECGGGSLCQHGRRKNHCKECSPVVCPTCGKTYSKGGFKPHFKLHLDG